MLDQALGLDGGAALRKRAILATAGIRQPVVNR